MKRGGRLKRCRLKPRRDGPRRSTVIRDPAYREWITSHPCVVEGCENPAQCCHYRNKRMWGDIGNCYPGCQRHHIEEEHRHGKKTFQAKHNLDLPQIVAAFGEAWAQRQNASGLPF